MTVYADTSALVTLYADEPTSDIVGEWIETSENGILISDLARLEFAAAMSRAFRIGRFDTTQIDRVFASFAKLLSRCETLSQTASDFTRAERLVRDFSTKLAAPDALHLATAIGRHASLLTLDRRMADAARMKGVEVIDLVR